MTGPWLAALVALAAGDPTAPADCAAPPSARPPDPRCGETLDGRELVGPSPDTAVARAALAVPRVATQVMLWPVVETSDVVEHYRLLDWMRALLTTEDGRVGVRPLLSYTTGFRTSAGARFFYRRLPSAQDELAAQFETAGPPVLLGRVDVRAPSLGLQLTGTWRRRDDLLFAGLGPRSHDDLTAAGQDLARYGSDDMGAEARWSHRLPARMVAYAHGDVRRRDYQATSVTGGPPVIAYFDLPTELPGFAGGSRLVHAGGGLGLGLRDPGREGAGLSLIVDGTLAHGVGSDPSQHATLSAESVLALGGVNRTFIVRGRAATVERLGDAPVPFEELVSPAGQAGMRGFPEGRFRGASGLVGTAEYRWYISSYLDASLFTDVGTVAGPTFSGIVWDRWFPSFGLGFRLFKTQGAYWDATPQTGLQLAYAPDSGFRFLLAMAGF